MIPQLPKMEHKIRIYDLAKELRRDNKFIIEEVRREGIDVSAPSHTVPSEVAYPPMNIPMESIQIGSTIREFWRVYPVRISGHSTCRSCNEQTVLVQSMEGGFVTRNCPTCGLSQKLPKHIFRELDLWVACPRCKKRMEPDVLVDKNYGYVCRACHVSIALFELLPRYQDL